MARVWGPLAVVYAAFLFWYGGCDAPLSDAEVQRLSERIAALAPPPEAAGVRKRGEHHTAMATHPALHAAIEDHQRRAPSEFLVRLLGLAAPVRADATKRA